MRKYLADEIGDEYKNWKNGNIVLINAPTGSGKTTFIIEKFLARELNQGRKILYLVNRKRTTSNGNRNKCKQNINRSK